MVRNRNVAKENESRKGISKLMENGLLKSEERINRFH